ncbi:hypothetical protein ILYODFUR_032995 [Ilyodon furcidens]|uniref:Uncharacterized protein n=1 Tax=Ilyodon furcidens TaxID=33524 RepID=A0ABV0TZS6_9TELE
MGNCVRKQPTLEGDAKFMHSKDPDTVKKLTKWQKEFSFKRGFSVPACTHLVLRLKQKVKLKRGTKGQGQAATTPGHCCRCDCPEPLAPVEQIIHDLRCCGKC